MDTLSENNHEFLQRLLAGETEKPFVVAEIGQAHDGSLGQALNYIIAAAEAGANAVKFQTHFADEESSVYDDFRVRVFPQDATRKQYWQRMEFSEAQWKLLAKTANDNGLVFLSSPFSVKAVEILSETNMPAWKIASGELLNYPMLDKILETQKPLLISSGMSSWEELERLYQYTSGRQRVFFQCTTEYPSAPDNIGLNNIEIFKRKFPDVIVGLSDHSGETYPSLSAYIMGARIFEVHIAWSKQMFGPDTAASLTLSQLKSLIRDLNLQHETITSPVDKDVMRKNKNDLVNLFSRGIYAVCDMEPGHVISETDIKYLKPAIGISASEYRSIIGSTIAEKVNSGEPIKYDNIEK